MKCHQRNLLSPPHRREYDYRLASTPDQAIIFLQLDTAGQCRTGKIMHYNPSTGKRIKDENTPGRINWLHTTLKRRKIIAFPDIDAYYDWLRRTADFPHLDIRISRLLEDNATQPIEQPTSTSPTGSYNF